MPRKIKTSRKSRMETQQQVPALPTKVMVTGRGLRPDLRFNDLLVAKFINCMMRKGMKSVSQNVFYGAMKIVGEKTGGNPMDVFTAAMNNVKPSTASGSSAHRARESATLALKFSDKTDEGNGVLKMPAEFRTGREFFCNSIKRKVDDHPSPRRANNRARRTSPKREERNMR